MDGGMPRQLFDHGKIGMLVGIVEDPGEIAQWLMIM
jgi:hypothetical protein